MLAAELITMIEVRTAGRAVLVLSSGEPVAIQLWDFFDSETAFAIVGTMPWFQVRSGLTGRAVAWIGPWRREV
jgi:hypothetical protein